MWMLVTHPQKYHAIWAASYCISGVFYLLTTSLFVQGALQTLLAIGTITLCGFKLLVCSSLFGKFFLKFKDFSYLFLERRKGREKERRETSMCGCLSYTPYWGSGLQLRHMLQLGIKLVTLWFSGLSSIHWATPARAIWRNFLKRIASVCLYHSISTKSLCNQNSG